MVALSGGARKRGGGGGGGEESGVTHRVLTRTIERAGGGCQNGE